MTNSTTVLLLLLAFIGFGGCDEPLMPPPMDVDDRGQVTTERALQDGVDLIMLPDTSTVSLSIRWDGWKPAEGSTELTLRGGDIALSANEDGIVTVESIRFDIGDIVISSDLLDSDLHLTNVSAQQPESRRCEVSDWSEDRETCNASLQLNLVFDWTLVTSDGHVLPLGTQELSDIPMEISLSTGRYGISATLHAESMGTVWSFANLVELYDLRFDIGASEPDL